MLTIRRDFLSMMHRQLGRFKHPNIFSIIIVGLLASVITLMIIAFTRGVGGTIILTPPTGPATGGTSVTMAVDTSGGGTTWDHQTIDFPFGGAAGTTGLEQTFTAPIAGLYQLEVWGAQGGNAPTGGQGGRGGYSTVTVQLNAGQTIYIAAGGQGGAAGANTGVGGWNGGGGTNSNSGGGGGGASHISLSSGLLNNATVRTNLLVAAGGGGGTQTNGVAGCHGGWGGGTTGGPSQTNVGGGGACTGNGGAGGTQTAGGASLANQGATGSAGQGATSTQQGGSNYAGGGGGGWFGGGAANGTGGGGGGGSGWLRTAALNGVAITNSQTLAGNQSFLQPDGTTAVGHAGAGYARVTILAQGLFVKPTVRFGIQGGTVITIADANVTWCNYNGSICTNGGAPNTVTFTTPARGSLPTVVDVWLGFDPTTTGEFTYWTPATSYTHTCSVDDGANWSTQNNIIYAGIGPDTGALCRIVLNAAFSGTIELSDDYYDTIDPELSGTFSSSDPRFDPGTNTFTVNYTDTYNPTGQTLYYTYNAPDWDTLVDEYWDPDNQDDLMWPGLEVVTTPAAGVQPIVLTSDSMFLGIWAESYKIITVSSRFCEECTSNLLITTYGAPYEGSIDLFEDLSDSDDPFGTPAIFSTTTLNFASANGNDMSFTFTPFTTSPAPNWTTIYGVSRNPAITDDSIDVNVAPATMRLLGPNLLSREETGSYTLVVYVPNFTGTIDLHNILIGADNGPAGGEFVDTSASNGYPGGTFDPIESTYTFTNCSGTTCTRTFDYTVSATAAAPTILLDAIDSNNADNYAFLYVNLRADTINFRCGSSNPNCTIAYVGEPQDYNISPNGLFTGSVVVASPDPLSSFSLGNTAAWSNTSNTVGISYTPGTPGRYILSATTSSSDTKINGRTFYSNSPTSLNDYIWVIANETAFFTGDDTIPNAGSGYFTLALNGPFIGTILLTDTMGGVPQGGSWSNGGSCAFTLDDYDPVTNTTSCTFTYTPAVVASNRLITIAPVFPPEFSRPINITPRDVLVYGYPSIQFISPEEGPTTGGTTVFITGISLSGVSFITFDGAPCINLSHISDNLVVCQTPDHLAGTVDVLANNIVPDYEYDNQEPPNIIGGGPLKFTYFDVATDYINECYVDDEWTNAPYVVPGTTVNCRIVFNDRWQGLVMLSDDYAETIDPDLSGTFASSDPRFIQDIDGARFDVGFADTADSTGQTLEYTWTSPIEDSLSGWDTLKQYWDPNNQDDLWWPMINVDIPIDEYDNLWLLSSENNVVFGLLAQEYFITPEGDYSFYCIGCIAEFIVSTYGAPYEGIISFSDDLSHSDNPSGTPGTFSTQGITGNPRPIDFAGTDGTETSFSYTPATTAEDPPTFIRLYGVSSDPDIKDSYYDIAPVLDPGILIIPGPGFNLLNRGETGTYTLMVTFDSNWSGTVQLDDVFQNGTAGGGVFVDISGINSDANPFGTFNPGTNTYTFTAGPSETYERTFTYTLRDDGAVGPLFPSNIIQLTAESNSPNNQSYTNIYIYASRLRITCPLTNPNCHIGYVGRLQDYLYSPNGGMMGSVNVSASDVGALGTLTWPAIAGNSQTMSYTPHNPGRQVLTATVNPGSVPSSLVNQSFASTNADSLNDYIWVMANQMTLTGPGYLKYGATGTFTLTMNGPFIGNIFLEDTLDWDPADGSFDNNGVCIFTLLGYDPITNTTSCIFDYTPDLFEDVTTIVLTPDSSGYTGPLTGGTPLSVIVYGRPIITEITPTSGPTIGGTGFGVSHNPSGVISLTGANLASGSGGTLNLDSITIGHIPINLSSVQIIDSDHIALVPPPNMAGSVDIIVVIGSRTYHQPDIYTYIPEITSIDPILGPTTGGLGFGAAHNPNGTVTITGQDIARAVRYSDGIVQYYGLEYLDFTSSQYIDTGVNQIGNTNMALDFTYDDGQYIAGVLASPSDYFMMTINNVAGSLFSTASYGNTTANAGSAVHAGYRINASLNADGTIAEFSVRLNSSASGLNVLSPITAPSTGHDIYLGSANSSAKAVPGGLIGRVYSMVINKDSVSDNRNFVPVCTMDGTTGGMFDTIHNVFYPSDSGTPFTCDNSSIAPPTVSFGGTTVPADFITVVDLNTITVIPPPHGEGTVDVDVVVNGIPLTLTNAYTYRIPLTIFTVDPPAGPFTGGTNLTITGINFLQDQQWQQISTGLNHACAIDSFSQAYCWGNDSNGQLGNGAPSSQNTPTPVNTTGVLAGKTLTQISAGDYHTCALDSAGKAYCWGLGTNGQLGNNLTSQQNSPVAVDTNGVLANKVLTHISAGHYYTCAIDTEGKAYCWGLGTNGQLGNNNTSQQNTPVAVNTSGVLNNKIIQQISTGYSHTCAIDNDGKAYCWGLGTNGRLGNNSTAQQNTPVAVSVSGVLAGKTITNIASGSTYTCAVANDGRAYCWGYGADYQLGNANTSDQLVPVAVYATGSGILNGKTLVQIAPNSSHTCAIDNDGKAYCWGLGINGQLGNNNTAAQGIPAAVYTSGVLAGKALTQIATALYFTCALDSDGKTYCWGYNNSGQLGNGSSSQSNVPVSVFNTNVTPKVTVGNAPCINVVVISDTVLTCTTTAHDSELVSVFIDTSFETYTMPIIPDPIGNGMPTTDSQGRSIGGFLYLPDVSISLALSTDISEGGNGEVDLSISLSVPFDENYALAMVATNNINGYTLSMHSAGANLVCSSNSGLTIPSTVGNAIDGGSWGFQVRNSPTLATGWASAPLSPTQIDSSNLPTYTVTNPPATRNTQVNFAVRNSSPIPINTSCPEYKQTITYSAVVKVTP